MIVADKDIDVVHGFSIDNSDGRLHQDYGELKRIYLAETSL